MSQDIFSSLKASGEPPIPNFANLVHPSLPKMDINEVWNVQSQKWQYQCDYLAAIREFEEKTGHELDAIIAPIAPTAAVRHDEFRYYGYSSVINLLDFTSVVVPVTFVDKAVDLRTKYFKPITQIDHAVQAECKLRLSITTSITDITWQKMTQRYTTVHRLQCRLSGGGSRRRGSCVSQRR